MDDCLVFTKRLTRGEHMEKVKQILQKMRENNLYMKIGKCKFVKPEMEFLGWIVDKNGLRMDPKKISVVTKWQPPTRVKGVRSFFENGEFLLTIHSQVCRDGSVSYPCLSPIPI